MALTLARIVDGDTGKVIPGTAGVSMFYLETRVRWLACQVVPKIDFD